MASSLEQYANYLDSRRDLPWPAAPSAMPIKAKPHIARLAGVRAVLWNVYGTLLAIPLGELLLEHPTPFVMNNALDRTIHEFKMWASMSRKPGQPADDLLRQYRQILSEHSLGGAGERHPEIQVERIWEVILKRLMQKDYKFDASFFGAMNEYSRKVAYFFPASLQGTACYEGAATAMKHVAASGLRQGLLADGQCFTTVQLQRGLSAQDGSARLDDLLNDGLVILSSDLRGKKPSERLFRMALDDLQKAGLAPEEILHVGSRMNQDIIPAKRLGMKTALFAGDKVSVQATSDQIKDAATRPDVLLTELDQITEVVGS